MKIKNADRFWKRVNFGDGSGCWTYAHDLSRYGYGRLSLGRSHRVHAHQYAWTITMGRVPDGMVLMHSCDNPVCVRIDHLSVGTQSQNLADCRAKGRTPITGHYPSRARGEKHGNATTSSESVRAIRARYKSGESQSSLASAFGMSQPNISRIVRGKAWGHIKD